MPIHFEPNLNIFHCNTEAIVNTVNTKGAMGKGLALAFKNRYPKYFESYLLALANKQLAVGKLHWYQLLAFDFPNWIVSFPTKELWWNKSKEEYIVKGLLALKDDLEERSIQSIAIPKLGCNNGGLDWNDVRPLIVQYLKYSSTDIVILGSEK